MMGDDLLDLVVGHERPVDARDAPAARHVEHVALAEQLLGALLAENGAAVDLARDLERDAGREIGLDRAGDDVDRGALRRHDEMDAGGARHLREALDRALDVLAGDHHEVGHFVDDDDDVGQFVERDAPRTRRSLRRSRDRSRSGRCGSAPRPWRRASATRALKPSMLRTPTFDIFL